MPAKAPGTKRIKLSTKKLMRDPIVFYTSSTLVCRQLKLHHKLQMSININNSKLKIARLRFHGQNKFKQVPKTACCR